MSIELNELKESQSIELNSTLHLEKNGLSYKIKFINFIKELFSFFLLAKYDMTESTLPLVITEKEGVVANSKIIESITKFIRPFHFTIKTISNSLGFLYSTNKGIGLLNSELELEPHPRYYYKTDTYLIPKTGKYLFILGSNTKIKFILKFFKQFTKVSFSISTKKDGITIFGTTLNQNYLNTKDLLFFDHFGTKTPNLLTILGPDGKSEHNINFNNTFVSLTNNYLIIKHLGA